VVASQLKIQGYKDKMLKIKTNKIKDIEIKNKIYLVIIFMSCCGTSYKKIILEFGYVYLL